MNITIAKQPKITQLTQLFIDYILTNDLMIYRVGLIYEFTR